MDRRTYVEQVLANLRRVTPDERAAIRDEIDGHIEDHICDLIELGYDEKLAEERAMSFMGDPAEVGRELDKQYPLRWLVLGRVAVVLTVVLCIQALTGFGILFHARDSVMARLVPSWRDDTEVAENGAELSMRMTVGNDIVRVYRAEVWDLGPTSVAEIGFCTYDRIPGGIVSEELMNGLRLENQRGEVKDRNSVRSYGNWGAEYGELSVEVAPGDTYVVLVYEGYGRNVSMEIPLPVEVTS
ncbi:permease prefix domain 1-containing protein [Oscillibacter sp.]|uniref:permease prefix domain 1-containing protein n=1 Tax=Oscillibacter sp. TaxID=1945593 RepID=UPI001B78AB06|nr:permease prefix domain 1-containing protein [Oscillibacter sp.]MBP3509242.1 hypothetical protein [Oscillibacter sp.]